MKVSLTSVTEGGINIVDGRVREMKDRDALFTSNAPGGQSIPGA